MLHDIPVVLASASPRRAQIFSLLGIKASVFPADIAEPITDEAPELQAIRHAENKAACVAESVGRDTLIVAADTVVAIDEHILGKPRDETEAHRFLNLLSNRQHKVYTGICLLYLGQKKTACEQTEVLFAKLSEPEIKAYLATGEPMDKAGAYGIQGYGAQFITRLEGCYFNVMGFPVHLFYKLLQSFTELRR